MANYRLFPVTEDGHVLAPAKVIECADDCAALSEALQESAKHDVEVWDGARLVGRIDRAQG